MVNRWRIPVLALAIGASPASTNTAHDTSIVRSLPDRFGVAAMAIPGSADCRTSGCLALEPSAEASASRRRRIFLQWPLVVATSAAASIPELVRADDGGGSAATLPPLRPPPMAGGTAAVVPGLAARLRPVVVDGGSGWAPSTPPATDLGRSRILAADLSPLTPSLSPLADRDVYYPPWLLGSWDVTATLRRKVYPYGTEFVPSQSLVEGSPRYRLESPGDSTRYDVRYVKGGDDKVISDRASNAVSLSRAYRQLTPVQDVQWDPWKDPTRLTLSFGAGPLTDDMMPLGQRRAEIYITARRSTAREVAGADSGGAFCASERIRLVTISPGNVQVSDTETITEFRVAERSAGGEGSHVFATSRIAVYLTPNPNSREGVLWEQVRGRAVAFFDYELDMRKTKS